MRSRRVKWSIAVLAVLLNLGGGPMVWAHALGGVAAAETPACHADPDHTPAPASHPCCDGGGCSCAVPALSVALLPSTTLASRVESIAVSNTSALPARPIDDTLRPPIH